MVLVGLFSFLIGFAIGVIVILSLRVSVSIRKQPKQYGYSSQEKRKIVKANDKFLNSSVEEHSANDFK